MSKYRKMSIFNDEFYTESSIFNIHKYTHNKCIWKRIMVYLDK